MLAETLAGAAGALLVLAFVFGSFLALVPLLIAAVAILTTFLAVLGLTGLVEVSFIVQFLVALIGLGVAVDYSLLVDPLAGRSWAGASTASRPCSAAYRRAGRGDQREHCRRWPAGPGPAAGADPAVRLRRPAHLAGRDPGHPHPAPGPAGHRRALGSTGRRPDGSAVTRGWGARPARSGPAGRPA